MSRALFILKPLIFLVALGPAAWLVWAGLTGNLSANPLSDITNETGVWTLRFLCITLAVTPLRRITGWNWIIRFRRMLGLFAFFYGTLHFLTYVIVDRFAGLDHTLWAKRIRRTWKAKRRLRLLPRLEDRLVR